MEQHVLLFRLDVDLEARRFQRSAKALPVVGDGRRRSRPLQQVGCADVSLSHFLEELKEEKKLEGYPLLPAVRAHLLEEAGRSNEARSEFLRPASLTRNEREREVLLRRAGPGRGGE